MCRKDFLQKIPECKIFHDAEKLPYHIVQLEIYIGTRRNAAHFPKPCRLRQMDAPEHMEIVGDDPHADVLCPDQLRTVGDVLRGIRGLVLHKDPLCRDPLLCKIRIHAFGLTAGLIPALAAGHDADRILIVHQICIRRIQPELQHCAGPLLLHLRPKNNDIIKPLPPLVPVVADDTALHDHKQHRAHGGKQTEHPSQ